MSRVRTCAAATVAAIVLVAASTPLAPSRAAGPAAPPSATVFAAWDTDHDKRLSPGEFNAGWTRIERAAAVRQLKAQFRTHDRDRSGALDAVEYARLPLARKAGAAPLLLSRFDANKNAMLEFDEYLAAVNQFLARGRERNETGPQAANGRRKPQ